jgi:hypothetical protein
MSGTFIVSGRRDEFLVVNRGIGTVYSSGDSRKVGLVNFPGRDCPEQFASAFVASAVFYKDSIWTNWTEEKFLNRDLQGETLQTIPNSSGSCLFVDVYEDEFLTVFLLASMSNFSLHRISILTGETVKSAEYSSMELDSLIAAEEVSAIGLSESLEWFGVELFSDGSARVYYGGEWFNFRISQFVRGERYSAQFLRARRVDDLVIVCFRNTVYRFNLAELSVDEVRFVVDEAKIKHSALLQTGEVAWVDLDGGIWIGGKWVASSE